jgi:Lrp/AsnC family transcriptional regulator for asnA, asnC and gidA
VYIDDLDKEILKMFAKNSRLSIRELARRLGVPHTTVRERVRRLEKDGIIQGYTVRIDYKRLGYMVTALILANVIGRRIVDVEEWLSSQPNVLAVYDITGEYDIALLASFRDIDELDSFVKEVLKNPWIKQTRTSIVFRKVKEWPHLPL